jgi:hypothetical protein
MSYPSNESFMAGLTAGLVLGAASCVRNGADRQADIMLGEAGISLDDPYIHGADNYDVVTLVGNLDRWQYTIESTGNEYVDSVIRHVEGIHIVAALRLAKMMKAYRDTYPKEFDEKYTAERYGNTFSAWFEWATTFEGFEFWQEVDTNLESVLTQASIENAEA